MIAASFPRAAVLSVLARRHLRVSWRTKRLILPLLLIAVNLAIGSGSDASMASIAFLFFTTTLAVAIVGAGAVARDFESGTMVLDRAHGAAPLEISLASVIHVAGVGVVLVLAMTTVLALQIPSLRPHLLDVFVVLALAITAWSALLVALGSIFPGYGNVGVAVLLMLATSGEAARLHPAVGAVVRWLRDILPLSHQGMRALRGIEAGVIDAGPIVVLALGTVTAVAVATAAIALRDSAGRWRQ